MRIDLNTKPREVQECGNSVRDRGGEKVKAAESEVQDQAQISAHTARVEALEKHINTVPEIRQAKVDALRAAMRAGGYRVSPGKIAEAMFSAMLASG